METVKVLAKRLGLKLLILGSSDIVSVQIIPIFLSTAAISSYASNTEGYIKLNENLI